MIALQEKVHKRYNILTGEWVLVSPHRTKRPWQGKRDQTTPVKTESYNASCYLCPGNTRASGDKNPNYTSTFSFINDFSALTMEHPPEINQDQFFKAQTEQGICKVICFSPDHSLTLPLMDTADIVKVVQLWKEEYLALGSRPEINHVQVFENKGAIMGCSNPHPHGQIWSQSTIPGEVLNKQKHQLDYWEKHKKSLLGSYLVQECEADQRILYQNDYFVVLIPFWAVWPYEAMIVPLKHYQHIGQLNEEEEYAFAKAIKVLTTKYDNLFETSFPYSSGIHQQPTDGRDHPEWHFHMSFYPPLLRSAEVKKFMVGYEMFADPQRDITAEQAAEHLKSVPKLHYTKKV
ncbi:UDP-glucose--hexose-1-phosphate uridylyltransferase [Croceiramulus getboli]|nr:UDP-glucose--hexose-1-phosphate uridylyltransferase [Flavobacteriaceae bacterium YJPT1-3]